MSELELSTTRNIVKGLKRRSKTEYFDVTMAILNLIVIIYVFTLLRNSTIISNLFGLFFMGILFIGGIITFFKRNPFYIYFFYGFTFCGIIGSIHMAIQNPFLYIIFIPQSLYWYSKIADLLLDPRANAYIYSRKAQTQMLEEKRRLEILKAKRREHEKKFKSNSLALIALCCSIGLFITLIISA